MYYAIITLSVIMFGVQFLFNNKFQKESGSGAASTFVFSFLSSIVGLVCLLVINKFQFGFTPFTFIMASVAAINTLLYTFCSLKAFEHINLSLYSLFAMLGGMALPFFTGIVFYNEPLTLQKAICLALITVALVLTVERGEKKKGTLYYAGVFILNGMSGVISKAFQSGTYEKCNEAVFSIWMALVTAVVSGVILLFMRKSLTLPNKKAVMWSVGYGILNKVANYFLLIALAVLPASVQYPFVTGGTMVVSTVISALCGQKPSKKEIIAVALSFVGIIILILE